MIRKVTAKIHHWVNTGFRVRINRKKRLGLKNKNFTLIASNCNGCLILHDLGLPYNSPFVNMYIPAEDYIRLLQNLDHYMSLEPSFRENAPEGYPIATLGDVTLHCVHYRNIEDVVTCWNRRRQRMDLSNCFVMFTDRDGCTQQHLETFDRLPMKNKVVFTHKPYPEIRSAFYISGFEEYGCVGNLYKYKGWRGEKLYDAFDYVGWFNGENF